MKNVPDKIYLQIDADGETPEDFKDLACVSWCEDKIHDNDIEYVLKSPVEAAAKEVGEWQLCPKCHGDGNLFRYNSPAIMGTNSTPICDVCNGNKIIQKPYLQSNPGEQGQEEASDAIEFMEWCYGQGYVAYADHMPFHDTPILYEMFKQNQ